MASTPEQRQRLAERLSYYRRQNDLTLDAIADALKEHGFTASASKVGGWAQGLYAPSSRGLTATLDSIVGAGGDLLEALGYGSEAQLLPGAADAQQALSDEERRQAVESWRWLQTLTPDDQERVRSYARISRKMALLERAAVEKEAAPDAFAAIQALWMSTPTNQEVVLAADTGDERGEAGPPQRRPSPPPEPEGP